MPSREENCNGAAHRERSGEDELVTYQRKKKRASTTAGDGSVEMTSSRPSGDEMTGPSGFTCETKKRKRDIGWEHGLMFDGNRQHWKCLYCGLTRNGGGVSRLKQHLAHKCRRAPENISNMMLDHIVAKRRQQRKVPSKSNDVPHVSTELPHSNHGPHTADSETLFREETCPADSATLREGPCTANSETSLREEPCPAYSETLLRKEIPPASGDICRGEKAGPDESAPVLLEDTTTAACRWKHILRSFMSLLNPSDADGVRDCFDAALSCGLTAAEDGNGMRAQVSQEAPCGAKAADGASNAWEPSGGGVRKVLCNLLRSEEFASLCNLLCTNFRAGGLMEGMDFAGINSGLSSGCYDQSPGRFEDDIRKVWKRFEDVGEQMVCLARRLSILSTVTDRQQASTDAGADGFKRCAESNGEKLVPAVEEAEGNSSAPGCSKLHQDCAVCERLDVAASPSVSETTGSSLSAGTESNEEDSDEDRLWRQPALCKMCRSPELEGMRFLVCDHEHCPYKFYHVRCLSFEQIAGAAQEGKARWYCPSCLCRQCFNDRDDEKILLCDGCDEAYHTYCLSPPLASIPEGRWYCATCNVRRVEKGMQRYEQEVLRQLGKDDDNSGKGGMEKLELLLYAAEKIREEERCCE